MQKILAQIGQFFEAHIEKLILVVAGLISLYILVTRVVISPNRINYRNQTLSVSELDHRIARTAKAVEAALESQPNTGRSYASRLDGPIDPNDPVRAGLPGVLEKGFLGLLSSPLAWLDGSGLPVPVPMYAMERSVGPQIDRPTDLTLPDIGQIEQVRVEHIRAAAYVPALPVDEANPYQEGNCDINDIDLVTVEGELYLTGLRERFRRAFSTADGSNAPELIFAAVQLQRQKELAEGQWGPWEEVPRSRVEPRRRILDLAGSEDPSVSGYDVRRIQLSNPMILVDLLQPPAYQIASAYEQWWPPRLHKDFIDRLTKAKRDEQRQAREQDRASRDGARPDVRRPGMMPGQDYGPGGINRGLRGGGQVNPMGPVGRGTRFNPRGEQPPVAGPLPGGRRGPGGLYQDQTAVGMAGLEDPTGLTEIYQRYMEIRLTPIADLNKMQRLVFWHHDDTVQPGGRYRYRIRLGVLNPMAASNHADGQTIGPILWSGWSEPTQVISIPDRQYIFPKAWEEAKGELMVEVCKFFLGYWRSRDFLVSQGETIGRLVEVKDQKRRRPNAPTTPGLGLEPVQRPEEIFDPDEIDFTTGAVFVGVSKVDGWVGPGNLKPQSYYEVLYKQADQVKRVPVGSSNWSNDLKAAYGEIKRLQRMPIEAPRPWQQDNLMPGLGPGYEYMVPGLPLGRDRGG